MENVNCVFKDGKGRLLIIDCVYNAKKLRVINMYASNNEMERKEMFESVGKWCNEHTIIVGDFNVVLTRNDISQNNVFKSDLSREKLFELIKKYNMIDIWRMFNKNKQYSRKQVVKGTLKQSRIDLCLMSEMWVTKVNKIC